jgi:lycopene beta-cyclase
MSIDAPTATARHDLVLAGGGLANGLIAWRLRQRRPELRLCLVEAGPTLGGNHTWSFHGADLDAAQHAWLAPLVVHHWPRHAVMFRNRSRWLASDYHSVSSERFHAVLMRELGEVVRLDTPIAEVRPTELRTGGGERLQAAAVIDGRGFRPSAALRLRYQKFVGLELALGRPHGLPGPILMDARVVQHDGYRFVYVLPLAADRVLIEDTYYADSPALDVATLRARALAYAQAQGWPLHAVLREEHGVLPIALDGDIDAYWREIAGQPVSGLRAALFHPTTGYSLPNAVRLADLIAAQTDLSAAALAALIERHARAVWRRQAFFRALNRMLYLAGQPETREQVLAHFYRLPDRLVGRFYGERLSIADKLRIVSGRPPVPVAAALRAVLMPRLPAAAALP